MGIPVLILGESGIGKSSSLRNFEPDEIGVFSVAGKRLPFRKQLPVINTSDYEKIKAIITQGDFKSYAIDDSQFLMATEFFDRAKETGYAKFTDIAVHFKKLIDHILMKTPPDTIVYFLHHIEARADGSGVKAKTIGKMLDEKLTVESLFTIVLLADIVNKQHVFVTTSDGTTPAKCPIEDWETGKAMFDPIIPNDLKYVDTVIRDFYGMKEETKNAEA